MVGEVVKGKIGDLEDELRERFYRRPRKELNDVVEAVSSKRRFLERFQDGCDKNMTSNKITVLTLYIIPVTK